MGQRRERKAERGIDKELHSRLRDVYKNGIHHKKKVFFRKDIQSKPQSATTLQYILNTENAISV